MFGTNE